MGESRGNGSQPSRIIALGETFARDLKEKENGESLIGKSHGLAENLQILCAPQRPPIDVEDDGIIPTAPECQSFTKSIVDVLPSETNEGHVSDVVYGDSDAQQLQGTFVAEKDNATKPSDTCTLPKTNSDISGTGQHTVHSVLRRLCAGGEKGPEIPCRKRFVLKRIIIMFFLVAMGIISAMHSVGYLIAPRPEIPDDVTDEVELGTLAYDKDVIKDFIKHELLMPKDYTIETTLEIWVCSIAFAVLTMLLVSDLVVAICTRHVPLTDTSEPLRPANTPAVAGEIVPWIFSWVVYTFAVTEPGARYFWYKVFTDELFEVALQLVRLINYSGRDILSGDYHPAQADQTVIFLTCVICADLSFMGLIVYYRVVFGCIILETVLDIAYTTAPFAALGTYSFNPAAWCSLRDNATGANLTITFVTSFWPILKTRFLLKQLDRASLVAPSAQEKLKKGSTESLKVDGEKLKKESTESLKVDGECNDPDDFDAMRSTDSLLSSLSQSAQNISGRLWIQGRVKGWLPKIELFIRVLSGVALLTWVSFTMRHPCEEILEGDGFWCAWITHPIMENPPCDCRVLTGNIASRFAVAPDDISPESFAHVKKRFMDIVNTARSIEWLFLREIPSTAHTLQPEFSKLSDWLKHAQGVQFFSVFDEVVEFPIVFRQAKRLRIMEIITSKVAHLPNWFVNFQHLRKLSLIRGSITKFPIVLLELPQLEEVDLSYNSLCMNDHLARQSDIAKQALARSNFICGHGQQDEVVLDVTGQPDKHELYLFPDCMVPPAECESRFGGFWDLMSTIRWSGICFRNASYNTKCSGVCPLAFAAFQQIDSREPFGALDWEEMSSKLFRTYFAQMLPKDFSSKGEPVPNFTFAEQLGCSMNVSGCQTCEDPKLQNLFFLSTFGLVISSVEGSDCSDCQGTPLMPYYSVELQDPSDPRKRKIG